MSAASPPALPQFTSPLAGELRRFLQFQRAAGYRYPEEARTLQGLDRFLAAHLAPGDPVIACDLVRAGAAVHLTLEDVDLARGLLRIRGAKFGKSRLVPLAPDLTQRLAQPCMALARRGTRRGDVCPETPPRSQTAPSPCSFALTSPSAAATLPRHEQDLGTSAPASPSGGLPAPIPGGSVSPAR